MIQIIKIDDTDYQGNYLIFPQMTDGSYLIENKNYEKLGTIEKERVGAWMSWVLYLESFCYLSAGCLDEVREMIKILNAKDSQLKSEDKK